MKAYYLLFIGLFIIGCQNNNKTTDKADPINEITYRYDNIVITRIDYYGKTEFYYGKTDSINTGVIWAKYSGINDGFKGYLKFEDNGKVFVLSGDGYFQSKNVDTSKFEYKRIYAYDEVNVGKNVCHIMLSTRYEQEFNNADSTGIVIHYKLSK
jgi:cupin superfamily acireductone dioxygenase involved in methionine salvage